MHQRLGMDIMIRGSALNEIGCQSEGSSGKSYKRNRRLPGAGESLKSVPNDPNRIQNKMQVFLRLKFAQARDVARPAHGRPKFGPLAFLKFQTNSHGTDRQQNIRE